MKSPIRLLSTGLLISGTALLAGCPIISVVKAPITPDGDVAGAPTDLVLNLDKSLDPAFPGRTLLANCAVRVTLPHKFVRVEPVQDVFTPGCSPAKGVQFVHILRKVRPSVEVTSALNPGAPNTIYQAAAANDAAPFPWDLLLWDRKGEPMLDVSVHMVNSRRALLKQNHRTVGHIRIHVPHGATGQSVAGGPSTPFNAPIKGVPTALLNMQFTAGSASGRYTTEVRLKGGNAIEFFVDVR